MLNFSEEYTIAAMPDQDPENGDNDDTSGGGDAT